MWKKINGIEYWTEEGRVWTSSSRTVAEQKAAKVGGKITEYPYKIIKNGVK